MDWFGVVQEYYNAGLWDLNRVQDAVKMGKITEGQYAEITGQDYVNRG